MVIAVRVSLNPELLVDPGPYQLEVIQFIYNEDSTITLNFQGLKFQFP